MAAAHYALPRALDLQRQAYAVPASAREDCSATFRSCLAVDAPRSHVVDPSVRTLFDMFQLGLLRSPDGGCLGKRLFDPLTKTWSEDYVWESYAQVQLRLINYGAGLLHIYDKHVVNSDSRSTLARADRLPPPMLSKWRLGLFSINRPEWIIAEQACNAYSLVVVPLYDTLGPDVIEYVINHSELTIIAASADKIRHIISIKDRCPCLRVIISMDCLSGEMAHLLRQWAAEKGLLIFTQLELENIGKQHPRNVMPPSHDDVSTICYTSGTTDDPKGAIMLHSNFAAANLFSLYGYNLDSTDLHLSYLPLAHIYERTVIAQVFGGGSKVAFSRGDVLQLIDDIATAKPTIFISVPRLYNRIYAKLIEGTIHAPGIRGALFRRAVDTKMERLLSGGGPHHLFWDLLLFNKVKQVLGGNIRLMITGSAPLNKEIVQFMRIAFSTEFLEGYGATESTACGTLQLFGDNTAGNVGSPSPCGELKLVDVPDMSYMSTDKPYPRGEICLRGYHIFKGYLKDEKKTREALDEEGWFHSGDIGTIDDTGRVSIIDRKKNIFKLAQGEYVAPEKIENIYLQCPLLAQIFIHGDSLQDKLVGIVVPHPETFIPWAKSRGYKGTLEELCANKALKELLRETINKVAKQKNLNGFEIVADIHLDHNMISIENGLLTPTFKFKRPQTIAYYRQQIDSMYSRINALRNTASSDLIMDKAKL